MKRNTPPDIRTAESLNLVSVGHSSLSNGIPVKTIRSGSEPVCRIDFVFEAGSRFQERIFQASLTNQMLPEGIPGQTGGQIAEQFEFYGSFINVSADRDEADLTVHTPEKFLEPVLALTREVIIHPTFPEEELNIIIANRIESMKIDEQRVESLARKRFTPSLFGRNHPYGVIGEIADLKKISCDHLTGFHQLAYGPANCRILLTGPNPDLYLSLVEKFFGQGWDLPVHKQQNILPPIQPNHRKNIRVQKPDAVQVAIRIGCPLFGRKDPDFQKHIVLNTILGGYFGSRLMSNIREEKGYTYGISSQLLALRDTGYFVIAATVGAEVWQQSIEECFREMQRLADEPVSPEELGLIRNYLTGQLQRSIDGPFNLAEQYRALWINDLDFTYLSDFLSIINHITPEDLSALANRDLNPDKMITVAAGPVKS